MDRLFEGKGYSVVSIGIGVAVGFCAGWVLKTKIQKIFFGRQGSLTRRGSDALVESENPLYEDVGECKLVLVVNNGLKMGKGKMAAQCSHAAVSCVEQLGRTNEKLLNTWRFMGQAKVVVKADDDDALMELQRRARELGLTACVIRDAGRTQIAPGSKTVCGVGPGPLDLINQVTGHLKLM